MYVYFMNFDILDDCILDKLYFIIVFIVCHLEGSLFKFLVWPRYWLAMFDVR